MDCNLHSNAMSISDAYMLSLFHCSFFIMISPFQKKYEALLQLEKVRKSKVAQEFSVPTNSISTWKNKKEGSLSKGSKRVLSALF